MENISNKYPEQLSRREVNFVYKVLEQYDFKVNSCTKVKSVYRIETSNGIVCLKRIKHGKHKSSNGSILAQEILNRDFHNIARYYNAKDGKNYVKYKKVLFYVTEWIDGMECNLSDIDEAISCVKLLAEFHMKVGSIDTTKLKIRNKVRNWPKKFNKYLRDLERFQKIIDKKRMKNEFDISYYKYLESFYYKGMISLNFLNTSDCYRVSNKNTKNRCLCHDRFYGENIIKKEDKLYLVELDSIKIDYHVNDLGKLISRLMYKKNYSWDFNKAKMLIEAYNSINKLNQSELELMMAFMIFPYKYWKLGKRRYLKQKLWDESKYLRKLNKITSYNELQNKFLEDFLVFINDYEENS